MSVEVLDGATIRDFVEDEKAFNGSVENWFASLDTNRDGLLSFSEMAKELRSLRVLETHFGMDEEFKVCHDDLLRLYDSLFLQFDHDGDGAVGLEEFRSETKKMMLAVANGIGFIPVQMVLEEDSFIKRAVDWETAKLSY